jgi:hypothetical protein
MWPFHTCKTNLSLEEHRTWSDANYLAFRWADGMGNPNGNWLPECQLDRITHLIEGLRWEDRKAPEKDPNLTDGIGFWMDTLCKYLMNTTSIALRVLETENDCKRYTR